MVPANRPTLKIGIYLVVLARLIFLPEVTWAHKPDVHGFHPFRHAVENEFNLTRMSLMMSDIQFQPADTERIQEGAVEEDLFLRYTGHFLNPHTGLGVETFGITWPNAVRTALNRWNMMQQAFGFPELRWLGDEFGNDGVNGALHALGRVLHLLQDMGAPPHVHVPDGHGWPGKTGPAGHPAGYYSDFEEKWSPSSTVFANWPFPVPGPSAMPLTPNQAVGLPLPNSALDQESLQELHARLDQIPSQEKNRIEGYLQALAWITYFHSSFYGEIRPNQNDPAPRVSQQGRPSALSRMFPNRISYHEPAFEAAYWAIDGVGYYNRNAQYFNDDWWPCSGPYSEGSERQPDGSILGRFYIYLNYYALETDPEPQYFVSAIPPAAWPDGTPNLNQKSLARYYGEVLLLQAIRFGAGLLQELFPAPATLTCQQTDAGTHQLDWKSVPPTDAGSPRGYQLERSGDGGNTWIPLYQGAATHYPADCGSATHRYRVRAQWFDSQPLSGTARYLATGALTVNIVPEAARSAQAQWRRAGTDIWFNAGDTETHVPAGPHTIEFKPISGWSLPSAARVTIYEGDTATLTGIYDSFADAAAVFGFLELNYADFFRPAGQPTNELSGWMYRYYPHTHTYMGILDGRVYVYGDLAGGLIEVGTVADWLYNILP